MKAYLDGKTITMKFINMGNAGDVVYNINDGGPEPFWDWYTVDYNVKEV